MADIIQLLPDFVANQIAAGEVIQRPASVVKELLENSIDAGASKVQLIVKDSGRTLIQVIDDGCGMSMSDARLSFERHATSKISDARDLFQIRTKGFRGEALASIASVAQVELKTRLHDEDLATVVKIDGSTVKECEPCQSAVGSSFSVRNLFFNVPARRQFLKSDQVEQKHIMDEFQRVALAHPGVTFVMHHNDSEVYHLPAGTVRQRVVGLFGQRFDERIMPVEESTDLVTITGFAGKPEFARKSRGEQFIFVNNRFIKHSSFHHAIVNAMEGLLAPGSHPMYVLYLEVDPAQVDVNIHPTKTEVKFKEDRAIYSILRSAVRKSLGTFQVAPTLDFDQETSLNISPIDHTKEIAIPQITVDPNYNPFKTERSSSSSGLAGRARQGRNEWKAFHEILNRGAEAQAIESQQELIPDEKSVSQTAPLDAAAVFQVGRGYIVAPIKSGMMVIDQQHAHERILYEGFMSGEGLNVQSSQQLLFPVKIALSSKDHQMIMQQQQTLLQMGLELDDFGDDHIIVRALPAVSKQQDAEALMDTVIHQLNDTGSASVDGKHEIALGLARGGAIRKGQVLQPKEMKDLIDRLFGCEVPFYSPGGQPAVVTYTAEELSAKFE